MKFTGVLFLGFCLFLIAVFLLLWFGVLVALWCKLNFLCLFAGKLQFRGVVWV